MKEKNQKKEKKPAESLVRINSRCRPDQLISIKLEASRLGVSDGELHRLIIDKYFKRTK